MRRVTVAVGGAGAAGRWGAPFRLRPGWPLTAVFVGYPLWWVLGISNFVAFIAAAIMVSELIRRRRIVLPPAFGWWAMFLLVVVIGVSLLQVNAPGALPETGSGGILTWAYRLLWYAAATIALLYVGNLREELSTTRLCRSLGWMFVVIVAGGWLGVVYPTLEFPSVIELVMPQSITNVEFVRFLVHPEVTQLYEGAVTDTPRPSAPFPYSNFWGLNYACFLPFFVVGWWQDAGRLRRTAVPVVLLLSLVPMIQSLNRGLWATLCLAVAFTAVRALMSGKVRLAAGVTVAIVATVAVLLTVGPVKAMIETRLENPTSNESRGKLAEQTVESMLAGSPVVGFGSTRDPQSSFYSIAGGTSAVCPLCSPPALGTQGHLWLVIYAQGFLGLVLYVGYFIGAAASAWRVRTPFVTAGLTVLIVHAVTSPVYDTVGVALLAILLAAGLLWREQKAAERPQLGLSDQAELAVPTTRTYVRLVRRNAGLIAVLVLLGSLGGLAWQEWRGVSSVGSVSVVLPVEPSLLTENLRPSTMDNEAQYARSPAVLDAVSQAVGHPVSASDINISANANTRILNIRYSARSSREAQTGAAAAAEAVLERRSLEIRDRLAATSARLVKQAAALQAALSTMNTSSELLSKESRDEGRPLPAADPRALDEGRAALLAKAGIVSTRLARAETTTIDAGQIVRPVASRVAGGRWRVSLVTGLSLGLVAGLIAASARETVTRRLRRRELATDAGLPVLAQVDPADLADSMARDAGEVRMLQHLRPTWRHAVGVAVTQRPAACIAVRGSPEAGVVAAELDLWVHHGRSAEDEATGAAMAPISPGTVLLVASRHSRVRDLTSARGALERTGQSVLGVVLV